MGCPHRDCTCQISGCGLNHPWDWIPHIVVQINGVEVGGDDFADCVAHYLIQCGYPTDRPDHLRRIVERMASRR